MDDLFDPKEVKKIIDKARTDDTVYNSKQFEFYHLNRNQFNVKQVEKIERIGWKEYRDEKGRIWEELLCFKNLYHMPMLDRIRCLTATTISPYSRKFLSNDPILGGEFEMILKLKSGQTYSRIDGLSSDSEFQETYNFSPSSSWSAHRRLDMKPHEKNSDYQFKQNMGTVKVVEDNLLLIYAKKAYENTAKKIDSFKTTIYNQNPWQRRY